jgi:solute:Na+ symporter, SSS family
VLVFGFSYFFGSKYNKKDASEFMTGGRHLNWKQTGLTLIAMMFDPGIMGISALAFVWGFYVVQWNAVNIWITGWFAGMFFVGIYWRSKIVTTPEYLEKRFNASARAVFSLLMVALLISLLAYAVYMGGILMNKFLGWNLWLNISILSLIAGFYVIFGGLRTMLMMDMIQGVLLLITLLVVGITGFILLGGFPGIRSLELIGNAGNPMNSLIPPLDFDLTSKVYFPLPAIPTYAVIAGLSWIICNFSMAQRLLAAKDESHAQKALIMAGIFNVVILFLAYAAGVAMRLHMPDIKPDEAFITLLLTQFPVGVRGLLIVGLIAALLSTIDGLIAASSALLTRDIFANALSTRNASEKRLKLVSRLLQGAIVLSVFLIIPVFLDSDGGTSDVPAYELIQKFLGNMMGVLIAIFVLGIFFTRTTARASFWAMVAGTIGGFALDEFTGLNFAHIGTIQFLFVIGVGYLFSFLEKPKKLADLENLTIWTIPEVKGPWIGLHSWPQLKYWAIFLPATWILITLVGALDKHLE